MNSFPPSPTKLKTEIAPAFPARILPYVVKCWISNHLEEVDVPETRSNVSVLQNKVIVKL